MPRVPDASARSLEAFALDSVAPGSAVRTDGWPGHSGLDRLGCKHETVVTASDPERLESAFPGVHRAASLPKRRLLGTRQGATGRQYPDYCPDEFAVRFNRRKSRSRGLLFRRLMEQAVQPQPAPRAREVAEARAAIADEERRKILDAIS